MVYKLLSREHTWVASFRGSGEIWTLRWIDCHLCILLLLFRTLKFDLFGEIQKLHKYLILGSLWIVHFRSSVYAVEGTHCWSTVDTAHLQVADSRLLEHSLSWLCGTTRVQENGWTEEVGYALLSCCLRHTRLLLWSAKESWALNSRWFGFLCLLWRLIFISQTLQAWQKVHDLLVFSWHFFLGWSRLIIVMSQNQRLEELSLRWLTERKFFGDSIRLASGRGRWRHALLNDWLIPLNIDIFQYGLDEWLNFFLFSLGMN